MVVYERGCLTLHSISGCGSVAEALTGCHEPISIKLPGGVLDITVLPDYSDVPLSGAAELVFTGERIFRPDGGRPSSRGRSGASLLLVACPTAPISCCPCRLGGISAAAGACRDGHFNCRTRAVRCLAEMFIVSQPKCLFELLPGHLFGKD